MRKVNIKFSNSSTSFYFNGSFEQLETLTSKENTILLTDEHVFGKNKKRFKGWKTIVIKAGEKHKNQSAVDTVIEQLIEIGADRKTFLVGVGGGVVTDITGYVAGIYMRGISFGFIPTSVLAMVDASIGGKNGIDVGVYKNMVGLIRQPAFLLYDYSLLQSLPKQEWINGFAEIIKHACIKDAAMFKSLEKYKLHDYKEDTDLLNKLIQRNALLKSKVVAEDEFEQGDRKLLNFGHTLGHAIENTYDLPHGHAIAIGMVAASTISSQINQFAETERVSALLKKYHLPVSIKFNADKVLKLMQSDKKRVKDIIHFVVLEHIGKAVVQPLSFKEIAPAVQQFSHPA